MRRTHVTDRRPLRILCALTLAFATLAAPAPGVFARDSTFTIELTLRGPVPRDVGFYFATYPGVGGDAFCVSKAERDQALRDGASDHMPVCKGDATYTRTLEIVKGETFFGYEIGLYWPRRAQAIWSEDPTGMAVITTVPTCTTSDSPQQTPPRGRSQMPRGSPASAPGRSSVSRSHSRGRSRGGSPGRWMAGPPTGAGALPQDARLAGPSSPRAWFWPPAPAAERAARQRPSRLPLHPRPPLRPRRPLSPPPLPSRRRRPRRTRQAA